MNNELYTAIQKILHTYRAKYGYCSMSDNYDDETIEAIILAMEQKRKANGV